MFARIARRYDLINRIITFGRDRDWRRWVVDRAELPPGGRLLDVGAGTGDIAVEAMGRTAGASVIAADFTLEMMEVGRRRPGGKGIRWCQADALRLPFRDASFDAVTSGYLIRNVTDARLAFREQLRVVKPGGRVVCLDTCPQMGGIMAPLVRVHMGVMIPLLGRIISGDRWAYRYLPESTSQFMTPRRLASVMGEAGLSHLTYRTFMMGTQMVHVAVRPNGREGS